MIDKFDNHKDNDTNYAPINTEPVKNNKNEQPNMLKLSIDSSSGGAQAQSNNQNTQNTQKGTTNYGNYANFSIKKSLKEQYEKFIKKNTKTPNIDMSKEPVIEKKEKEANANNPKTKKFFDTSMSFDQNADLKNTTFETITGPLIKGDIKKKLLNLNPVNTNDRLNTDNGFENTKNNITKKYGIIKEEEEFPKQAQLLDKNNVISSKNKIVNKSPFTKYVETQASHATTTSHESGTHSTATHSTSTNKNNTGTNYFQTMAQIGHHNNTSHSNNYVNTNANTYTNTYSNIYANTQTHSNVPSRVSSTRE